MPAWKRVATKRVQLFQLRANEIEVRSVFQHGVDHAEGQLLVTAKQCGLRQCVFGCFAGVFEPFQDVAQIGKSFCDSGRIACVDNGMGTLVIGIGCDAGRNRRFCICQQSRCEIFVFVINSGVEL